MHGLLLLLRHWLDLDVTKNVVFIEQIGVWWLLLLEWIEGLVCLRLIKLSKHLLERVFGEGIVLLLELLCHYDRM